MVAKADNRVFAAEIAHGLAERYTWAGTPREAESNVEAAVERALGRLWGLNGPCRLHSVSMMPIVLGAGTPNETTWCLVGVIAEKV